MKTLLPVVPSEVPLPASLVLLFPLSDFQINNDALKPITHPADTTRCLALWKVFYSLQPLELLPVFSHTTANACRSSAETINEPEDINVLICDFLKPGQGRMINHSLHSSKQTSAKIIF